MVYSGFESRSGEGLSLVHAHVQCPRTVRVHCRQTLYAVCLHTVSYVHTCLAAGMCAGRIVFNDEKEMAKICGTFSMMDFSIETTVCAS